MKQEVNIFWFRRDLRLNDNHGLFLALKENVPVLPVFIFDTEIITKLEQKNDARITFIYHTIAKLKHDLEKRGSSLRVFYSTPQKAFKTLLSEFEIKTVFANKDYEPYGMERDRALSEILKREKTGFRLCNDHVIFEPNTITKDNGEPYTVYTPYAKKWIKLYGAQEYHNYPSEQLPDNFIKTPPFIMVALQQMGFVESDIEIPALHLNEQIIADYGKNRDIPFVKGTSRLGIHLRFGTISIRALTELACHLSETFLKELVWRNFFIDILWHFPHVVNQSFKPKYDFIEWRNNEKEFERWCSGQTGFPLVDAGMRELNSTGFMHNRVRMVVASFLTKHLLIDWRWGETYFAEKLLDFELASNNGNWQWAAGCGCDAAPYFRIFNPVAQQKKFDPGHRYILKWVPELGTQAYPAPMVDHKQARTRALDAYKRALNERP